MWGQILLVAYKYRHPFLLSDRILSWFEVASTLQPLAGRAACLNDNRTSQHLCHYHSLSATIWSEHHSMGTAAPLDQLLLLMSLAQKPQRMLAPSAHLPLAPRSAARWVSRASTPASCKSIPFTMETVLERKLSIYKSLNSIIHLYCVYTAICYLDWITNHHL